MTAATRAIESDIKDFERTCDPATTDNEQFYQNIVKGCKQLCYSW